MPPLLARPFCVPLPPPSPEGPQELLFEPADADEQKCSEAEVLQHILEVESSRHRLERYARELSRLAEHSANAAREARQIARRKGDLVATLSHEMRTPLNGILGMLEHLQSRPLPPEELGYVQNIRQAGESLLSLVDSVLDLAKNEAGKFRLQVAPFDLRKALAEAVRVVQHSADSKGLTLVSEIDDQVPAWVSGDAPRLRQVVLNLLSNAIKFSETGVVSLRVQADPACDAKQMLRFTVTDNGIGISAEAQASLFRRFSQADASISTRFGGSGLGLAICKTLAELMGGSIGVASQPGEGSSFWFTSVVGLPEPAAAEPPAAEACVCRLELLAPVPPSSLSPAAARPNADPNVDPNADPNADQCPDPAFPECRLLLVEDNLINQKVILLMLKKLGFSAAVAGNGRQALQATLERSYDLIFMDCLMPEMDGWQATRAIRRQSSWGALVPIIAITANAFTTDRDSCLAAGMSDYLAKPVREAELKHMLDKWLPWTGKPILAEAATA